MGSSPRGSTPKTGTPSGSRLFSGSADRLWKIWWLWGIPVGWLTIALVIAAEEFREAGWMAAGDFLDVARLSVYWGWCRLAWIASGNASITARLAARAALAAGFAATVLT